MHTLQRFVTRRPLVFALLLTLATAVLNLGELLLIRTWPRLQDQPSFWLAGEVQIALLAIVLLSGLGWWSSSWRLG